MLVGCKEKSEWLMTLPVLYSCDKVSPRRSITESKLEINTRHRWVMELGPLCFLAQSQTQMKQKVRWLKKHKAISLCEAEQYLSFVFMSLIKYSFLSLLHKLWEMALTVGDFLFLWRLEAWQISDFTALTTVPVKECTSGISELWFCTYSNWHPKIFQTKILLLLL